MFSLDVRILGKAKDEDDINDAILAGKRIDNGDEFSTDDTGKGVVGRDTAGEQLPRCILVVSVMLRGHRLDVRETGEISSPDDCNGISEIERVLLEMDFDGMIEGVICKDLLLPSDIPDLTNPTAFKTLGAVLVFDDIMEVFLATAPTTSVSRVEFALIVDDVTVLIEFGIAKSCCCWAAFSSRLASNRLVSGGGRLQNAKLGEGGSDDG